MQYMYTNTTGERPSKVNLASFPGELGKLRTGVHAQNYHKEIKFLALQQGNHEQRTLTSKSNVESVTVESYMTSCVNLQTYM